MQTVSKKITPRGRGCALVGGGVGLLSLLVARLATGSPWAVFHHFAAGDVLPPLWLLSLLWFALPALGGAAAGVLFSCLGHAAEREACFWRGCTCLVLSFLFASAWYALLFGKYSLFFSGLCLLAAALLSFLCAVSWRTLSVGASLVIAANALWYLMLLIWQISVALHA